MGFRRSSGSGVRRWLGIIGSYCNEAENVLKVLVVLLWVEFGRDSECGLVFRWQLLLSFCPLFLINTTSFASYSSRILSTPQIITHKPLHGSPFSTAHCALASRFEGENWSPMWQSFNDLQCALTSQWQDFDVAKL